MDDLLREFLTETNENIDVVDVELVRFEQNPNNVEILDNIFRLVHTIKGTCGFLNLPRLEALTHAAEALMDKFRDGVPITGEAVTLILATIDRIKALLEALERDQAELEGDDRDLIAKLDRMAEASTAASPPFEVRGGSLRPGEAPLDELERAFRAAPGPQAAASTTQAARSALDDKAASAPKGETSRAAEAKPEALPVPNRQVAEVAPMPSARPAALQSSQTARERVRDTTQGAKAAVLAAVEEKPTIFEKLFGKP